MKILAVSSVGGHWIELLRVVKPMSIDNDIVYVSTNQSYSKAVEPNKFYAICDFSRWNAYKIIPQFFKSLKILLKEKPDVVLSTGAAPGLTVLLAAKILGIRTIWIDSIASVNKLTMSGKIASKFASRVYTQWQELAGGKILFFGNIIE